MYQLSLLCLLPLVVSVSEQLGNNGIGYFGTSNVRYQKIYPPLLYLSGKSQSSSISTTTDNPASTTKTAPPTAGLPKINQVNVTTSSGPIYIPRRKPFILPRRPKLGLRPKQQPIHTSTVVELHPNLFFDKQMVKLDAPQPSLISVSQPLKVSAPQLEIQVISGPQTPSNITTIETSTIEMSVPNAIVSPTLTSVPPFATFSGPNASPATVQPEKEPVSFDITTEYILEKEPMSPPQAESILQTKPELNPTSLQEQDLQLRTESFLRSTPNLSKSNHRSNLIKLRPYLSLVPVLDSISVEEQDTTVAPFLNISDANQDSTTETPPKVEPAAGTAESLSIATNLSTVNTITFSPIIKTTTQPPTVTEIQPPLVTVPKLLLTETETQLITAPRVVIQLITDPQQTLNSVSAIYEPDVTSIQLNRTGDIELPTNTPTSVVTVLPKIEPALNVTNSEIIIKSELLPQLEPLRTTQPEPAQTTQPETEHITLPKSETTSQSTSQSKLHLHSPDTVSLSVMIQSKDEELIKEHTTVPPLRGDDISESSFTFEIPSNATNQTLVTTKSQLIELSPIQTPIITSQPAIMTTSPMSEAITTLPESVVLPNNQPRTVIVQLLMPTQASLSVAPQLPVTPVSKPLAVIESKSSVLEAPQKTVQPEFYSVSEVSDSELELSTLQEFKLDSRPNSELAPDFESEITFKPEVEISNKPYTYPIKLRPQDGIVTVPDSAWKHVSLKSQPVVLPPLLPRPIPVREPAYGRLYFTQYPITSPTNHVPKVTPITNSTLASSYNAWQTTQSEPEPTIQPESTTQQELEHTTLPKSEATAQPTSQSNLHLHTPDTVSLSVMIQSKDEELIKEDTTVPPLRGDDISESSFTFEIPANATNQTLVTTKSQLIELSPIQTPVITSQPAIMTTSPMSEAITTLPESVVLPNNQPRTVIVQLLMPTQASLSVAPQLPVTPVSKPLAVIESKSSVLEAPQKTVQPEFYSVSEVSDSELELSTLQEFKLDSRPNSELAPDFESEITFKPEVEISKKPYTYPIKLRPQDGIVTVPDSAWKHVSLKSQPVVLPPLLPRPIPVREPAYGRLYFTQYPITSPTNHVPKVTPITNSTLATSYNAWQTTQSEPESTIQPELTTQPESTTQQELEHTTLPKSEATAQPTSQSNSHLHTPDTVSLSVRIQSNIKEHTTVPPLRGDEISESSFTFEIPANATNQTLITTKSQPLSRSETAQPTSQSKLNLHTPDTISLAEMTQTKGNELMKEYTTVPPLRDDDISESSFTFQITANAINQTLITTKSQLIELSPMQTPIVTSQPAIMTTSPVPEATTTLPESVILPNNQPQTVIVQLQMPPQPSVSVAPQLPVTPVSKPLAVIASKSSVPEAPQKTDQTDLFSVSEVSDSKLELFTPQEFKQDARPNSKLAPYFESETTIKSEVEIPTKLYTYAVKLRPQVSFVTVPDSDWKYVSLKQQPAVLPPLLTRPNPVREPAYDRHYNIQYPITLSTNYVPKVTPSIKPSPAPFIFAKPYAMWQPNYGRDTPSTTAISIIEMTQNTTEVPSNNVFASKRPKSFNLDFVCKDGNGYYRVENECDAYILCQKNKAIKFSCPDGLYFNPAAKYNEYPCTYPSEVQCTKSTGKQNTIDTLTSTRQCPKQYGLFSMNDGDCSKYIMCNIGVATVMNCPAGLVFNPSTESCDWVANVPQCSPQVFKNYTCPDPPVDEYGIVTDIINKYKYRNQCTQYIACQRGYPRLLSCERGLAFDEESQSCIRSVYVQGCASYAV